jgi:glycosyltransferase involved in cell wall biosynthesis
MRIAYCTNVRLPSERAHGHQIAQMCDAFAGQGHTVDILAPVRWNPLEEDLHSYYGISTAVKITYLRNFDHRAFWLPLGVLGLWISNFFLRRTLQAYISVHTFDLLYVRTPALLGVLVHSGVPILLELHSLPRRGKRKFIQQCKSCTAVVCLTSPMKQELLSWGLDNTPILVEADAVCPALFDDVPAVNTHRKAVGIPPNASVLGYAGQLQSMGLSKGVEILLQAMANLDGCHALIAGGPPADVERLRASIPVALQSRVHFLGPLSHHRIPDFLTACDVLVYPAPKSTHVFYNRDTSPLKIFEYMMAERPIVCADLLPLHDIVDENMVTFFEPGNANDLARAVTHIFTHPKQAQKKVQLAKQQVQHYTWEQRARRILQAAAV